MDSLEVFFLIAGIAVLSLANFFGVRMWLGKTNRQRMVDASSEWFFWAKGGLGGILTLVWLALSLDVLAVAVFLAQRGSRQQAQILALPGVVLMLFWVFIALTGHPRWALPPWFRRSRLDSGQFGARAHVVTVNYVADAKRGTAPYFVVLCTCGNVGDVVTVGNDLTSAKEQSFADARGHSAVVEPDVKASLDPVPARSGL